MPYVRLTIAKPRPGREDDLYNVMKKLTDFAAEQPGCQQAWMLRPHDNSGELARITVYDDEGAAEHIAQMQHVMALRSEVNLIAEPGHTERAFFTD